MRFLTTYIVLIAAALLCSSGCRSNNTSVQCERETALLRAEILDLEDKYYALKNQYESSPNGRIGVATSGVVGSGVVSAGGIVSSPVYVESAPFVGTPQVVQGEIYQGGVYPGEIYQGEVYQGDVIYEDQYLPQGTVLPGTLISPPVDGGVISEGGTLPLQQSIESPQPTPAEPEIDTPTLETPELDDATTDLDSEQAIVLPDAGLELEIGYEDLELDLPANNNVDRLEIISAGTRGKDLDGIPGHDGIELMVRTLNTDGNFVELDGELSIVVEDQLAGEIGKWTFLPEELKLFLSRDEFGNMGTLLHLPWTGKIPVSKQIEIRVSMIVSNIEYIANHSLDIEPPTGQSNGPAIVGWAVDDDRWVSVPRSSQRNRRRKRERPLPELEPSASESSVYSIERPEWKPVR